MDDDLDTSPPPYHREAYPKLDIVAAKSAFDWFEGDCVCVYTLKDRVVGQLLIPEIEETFIVIHHDIGNEYIQFSSADVKIQTWECKNVIDNRRRSMVCPQCGKRRYTLYFKNTWHCAKCHRLLNRCQLVGRRAFLWEERDKLFKFIERGRPKGMHNRTFERARDSLAEYEAYLKDKPRAHPSYAHSPIIKSEWIPVTEVEDLWALNYRVLGGQVIPC